MKVQAQRIGQRWTRAWEAEIGRSVTVVLKNSPTFQVLHQAVLYLILSRTENTQQLSQTALDRPTHEKQVKLNPAQWCAEPSMETISYM